MANPKHSPVTGTFSQTHLREQALVRAGICPRDWSRLPRHGVEEDRKRKAKAGHVKHKGRHFDD